MKAQKILMEDYKRDLIINLKKLEEKTRDAEEKKKIKESIKEIEDIGLETFLDLRLMIWLVYLIGIMFIFLSIWKFFISPNDPFIFLGMGSLGVADILLTLFYHPMDRLQKASSDTTQHLMVIMSYKFIRMLREKSIENEAEKELYEEIADNHLKDLEKIMNLLKTHLE
ncbi:MAG: hypothetical protein ACTSUN_07715 [Promethearchaeota archaeon]